MAKTPSYEMLAAIAGLTGRKPPIVNIPRIPLYPLAYAAETLARITGNEPFLTVDALKMASHHCSSLRPKPS